MGAETFGSDVSGPAAVADPDRPLQEAGQQATARQEDKACVHGVGTDDGAVLEEADRAGLENLFQDFGALGLAPPTLLAADVGDGKSPVRKPR